tara:strand:+ start:536 stop:2164 length:1629 start_codon:yes stop_codon:yes gene_type:complete
MPRKIKGFIIILLFIYEVKGQPDPRFRPFDWVIFKGSGEIKSITEGFSFAYIATSFGGIKRFNLFGNYFDEPITTAQGLEDNFVCAVHFDMVTGLLWAASPNYLQYSFSREGDWYSIELESLGLSKFDRIQRIGSSKEFVWLHARSSYVKIDHSSGIMIGIYPSPDELEIKWSSGPYRGEKSLREMLDNYSIIDGWVFNGNELIDRLGRRTSITTGYLGNYGNIFFGNNDGSIFYGTKAMESFSYIPDHITNIDVRSLFRKNDVLYIGSHDFSFSKGVSKYNLSSSSSINYPFEETINMTPTPLYSLFCYKSELWAGGDGIILYHNQKDDYWRTLDQNNGIPSGKIFDLYANDSHLWIGSSRGLARINSTTLRADPIGIESIFQNMSIFDIDSIDNSLWIASQAGVFIYSNIHSQLMQLSDIGRKSFPEQLRNVVSIDYHDGVVFIASELGIIKYDLELREYDLLFISGIYSNKTIYSMKVDEKFIFLGCDNGLIKINKRTGMVSDYKFQFIGRVYDIIVDGKEIWLGTSNGLIKFLWKRHL